MRYSHPDLSRRRFLAAAGYSALAIPLVGQTIAGANNRVRIAILGCGIRGNQLAKLFSEIPDLEIAMLCDADSAQIDKLVADQAKAGLDLSRAGKVRDFRKVLDRDDIDAVVICSSNHWHTPMAIQAMQAGKDAYVEKPVSHNFWEGRQLVAAEKKYGRIVGVGYQNRSDPATIEGLRYLKEGNLGKILAVHVCCMRNRASIGGPRDTPLVPPPTVDYNLWLGPARDIPIMRPRFHYDWHWVWNTGNGEIGNQCPHEIDLASWVLDDPPLPAEIRSYGNRFGWNDAGETPNMQVAWYQQAGVPVVIEVNDLQLTPERNVPAMRERIRVGIVVHCEGGKLRGGRGGMYAVPNDSEEKLANFPGDGGDGHQQNFIDAVRSRDSDSLTSRVMLAERSSSILHLANTSLRAGNEQNVTALRATIGDNPTMNTIVDDHLKQLADWGIDAPTYQLGVPVEIDPDTATVTTAGLGELLKPPYRGPFGVPEIV